MPAPTIAWRSVVLLLCTLPLAACWTGSPPAAHRVDPDGNSRIVPQGEVHFLEDGRRARGVFVVATEGYANALGAVSSTVLVPLTPSPLPPPTWDGRPTPEEARALYALPERRRHFNLTLEAKGVLRRFRAFQTPGEPDVAALWIVGTDPFILALPHGQPRRTDAEYAAGSTGVGADLAALTPARLGPDRYAVRVATDQELDQPIGRLVIFPRTFWSSALQGLAQPADGQVVPLPAPIPLEQALDPDLVARLNPVP